MPHIAMQCPICNKGHITYNDSFEVYECTNKDCAGKYYGSEELFLLVENLKEQIKAYQTLVRVYTTPELKEIGDALIVINKAIHNEKKME